ncbi:hypothetical protein LTS18_010633 [Coniosporium uncinatum]|uniref:Uncharacterized protein n=1 Tax=Coniosporium uncinatum TaxID=93489 RepID=A0ACC3DZH1_9PEZI|nr:hypothetical protein LTS18_010633 [Coniosporium uncinatum]
MLFKILIATAAIAVELSEGSYTRNLNYRSPSEVHPAMGVSIHKVVKRNNPQIRQIDAANVSIFSVLKRTLGLTICQLNFTHGVASGDPYSTSVILWTRVAPMFDNDASNTTVTGYVPLYNHDTSEYVAMSNAPVCVRYEVSDGERFARIIDSGEAYTTSDIDYTVKVEATGLKPFTTHYYRFTVCDSDNPFGYFNAYGNPVRKDSVDYVVHLGDYIYEYANGEYGWGQSIDRIPLPDKSIFTLYDYRKRLATYRNDPDLQDSHGRFAWIPVWDDHEVSDNTYRDGSSHANNTEESFIADGGISVEQRKMNAVRAYFEWMPIRQVEMDDNLRIWRSFSFGDLIDLIMLDTRQYDRSITDLYWNTDYIHEISDDAGRTLMGSRQENWFYNKLSTSASRGATWRVIGSQVIFSKLNQSAAYGIDNPLNYDAWDGYTANRNRTLQHLYDNGIGNNIFLAGDSHATWVSDVAWLGDEDHPYDAVTGSGSIGAEFAGTAVSSPCPYGANISLATANNYTQWIVNNNPELQYNDLYYRGYYELHFDHDKVVANFFGLPTIVERNAWEIPIANFTVVAGENRLHRPVGEGVAESGTLKGGEIVQTNLTVDTETGGWFVSREDQEVL